MVAAAYGGKREGMVARPTHPIDKVRKLQRPLIIAAQRNRERRFQVWYDRIWRGDVLLEAWEGVRSNLYRLLGMIRYPGGAHAA